MNLEKRIFVGITDNFDGTWRKKLAEIKKFGLTEAALFLEQIRTRKEREEVYRVLEKSGLKKVPLIHIRSDMEREELKYLCEKYDNPCLTIHEVDFKDLEKWRGFYKNIFVEFNYNDKFDGPVEVEKIGGFCVDLSHFKAAEEKWMKEFQYVLSKSENKKLFACNHLNGYSYEKNDNMHTVESLKNFDYLKTLPEFVFGDVIAIETYNSIEEQLKFKEYLIEFLK